MNVLFIGDIVSRLGRRAVSSLLPNLREEYELDIVIANAENLAGGRGVTVETLDEMMTAGIDYFTSGDHIFWGENPAEILNDDGMRILRPANFAADVFGRGFTTLETGHGKLGIVNLIGRTFEAPPVGATDMFRTIDTILSELDTPIPILIDIHGEFTSEKIALAYYTAGRVSAVVGTHTHVGTVDTRILQDYTGFVTDVGMTGSYDSVIGVEPDVIIQKLKFPYPQRFEWVKTGASVFSAVLLTFETSGKCTHIERVDRIIP